MEIEISKNCKLKFDEIECDDVIPSISFFCTLTMNLSLFKKQIWVDCSTFDVFTESLIRREEGVFFDMSNEFRMSVKENDQQTVFTCSICEKTFSSSTLNVEYVQLLDIDCFYRVLNAFKNYPKWW
ncbi:hypothetical protein [Desulfovibrio litoralis]|uniref:Uncharacterized protein n=1 Tax=Desulfovibrio litoralis DSM 11393 TaxID=1121455 RepID=A0A1M7TH31_9BACT|nr:hypothetical protein [Desulfovibrio litoralis]SHN70016.1 hypothetical protein SAMN02745728_01988 [Desulfovibrio litoralis DSM 11393]